MDGGKLMIFFFLGFRALKAMNLPSTPLFLAGNNNN